MFGRACPAQSVESVEERCRAGWPRALRSRGQSCSVPQPCTSIDRSMKSIDRSRAPRAIRAQVAPAAPAPTRALHDFVRSSFCTRYTKYKTCSLKSQVTASVPTLSIYPPDRSRWSTHPVLLQLHELAS